MSTWAVYRARGLCGRCGVRPPRPGRADCRECRDMLYADAGPDTAPTRREVEAESMEASGLFRCPCGGIGIVGKPHDCPDHGDRYTRRRSATP